MSDVIKIEYPDPSICLIRMEDKKSRNTFSDEFIGGLKSAFEEIKKNSHLKVVITTGYESFFCCGGTQELLRELTLGKKTFTDMDFYKLPFECEIPTIAAVQGHALGGGLAFTCLFDFLIFSIDSYYSANFMKYGFTPGMGATFTLPRRFGQELGKEMLFSARNYPGKELKERCNALSIVSREQVLTAALKLAKQLSEKTLDSLKLLKKNFQDKTREKLASAFQEEVAMHAKSITSEEAKTRIEELFQKIKGGENDNS